MTTTRSTLDIALDLYYGQIDGATVPTVVGVPVPTSGYVVALPRHGFTIHGIAASLREVESWVADALRCSLPPSHYLGVWSDAHVTYFDVVEVLPERAAAVSAALSRGELCIFDLAAHAEIRVPEPVARPGFRFPVEPAYV